CRHALGMQSKRIPDRALSSSSHHAAGTQGMYARLERNEGDGAWCPSGYILPGESDQYLQIDLPEPNFITNVATQGRYANGLGREYTKSYMLNYSRDGETWFQWTNYMGVKLLQGNSDTKTVKRQMLNPGVAGASYIRIIPVSTRPMSVCLRLELYGCHWTSGLVSYDLPTPEDSGFGNIQKKSTNTKYSDDTYDGTKSSTWFRSGLGQLSDGIIGDNDLSRTNSRVSSRWIGFDYVGWSAANTNEVTLTFRFADVRNFTLMRVHCSNDMTIRARLFSSVKVAFSLNGKTFPSISGSRHLAYEVPNDAFDPTSRFVNVPLQGSIARYVRATFRIQDQLLLISEIEFNNSKCHVTIDPNVSLMFPRTPPHVPGWPVVPKKSGTLPTLSFLPAHEAARYGDPANAEKNTTNEPTVTPTVSSNLPVIIGSLIGVIALLMIIVLGLCYRQHRLLLVKRSLYQRCHGFQTSNAHLSGKGIEPTVLPTNDNLYLQPRDAVLSPPPPYQQNPEVTNLYHQPGTSGFYAKYALFWYLCSDGNFFLEFCRRLLDQPDVTKNTPNLSHYAESNIFMPATIQGVSGNNVYAVPCTLTADSYNGKLFKFKDEPPEFPREKLEVVEQLGEGQFGEVQLCKAHCSLRKLAPAQFKFPGEPDEPVLVAVKVLRSDATTNAKEDFLKEVRVMGHMQDPNIVHLLAVCTSNEPYAMITEYMEYGDLNQYLQSRADKMANDPTCKEAKINEILIDMSVQIASGMRYLSSHKFVHRDLATRNCLVDSKHSIRIADFGMSRNMYQSDYYRIQGRAVLPIRWMSWECVLMGKFSSASDVWAFGVTLWEIFSFCQLQPHSSLTDQQVIENMHHIFKRTGEEVHITKPKRCPATLFNLIHQCWKRQPEDRPTFQQLHSYL
uniref:Receptor protein-tyrosine kinase n=1 Tax=Ciona savignyi TaxID=51511 RepID=H2Z887_CIOSA